MFHIDLTYKQADKITVASILDSLDYHIDPDNYPTHDNPLDTWNLVAGFTHVIEHFCTREQSKEIWNEDRGEKLRVLLDRVVKDELSRDLLEYEQLKSALG